MTRPRFASFLFGDTSQLGRFSIVLPTPSFVKRTSLFVPPSTKIANACWNFRPSDPRQREPGFEPDDLQDYGRLPFRLLQHDPRSMDPNLGLQALPGRQVR